MKKRFALFLLFYVSLATAQVYNPDSLLRRLKDSPKSGKEKIQLYLALTNTFLRRNADSASYFQKLAEQEALKAGDLVSYGLALDLQGGLKEREGDMEAALVMYRKVITLADSLKSNSLYERVYSSLGSYYNSRDDYRKALEFSYLTMAIIDSSRHHDRSRMLYNMGLIFVRMNQLDSAENHYQKGLEEAQLAQSENLEGLNYSGMAFLKFKQNKDKEALKYAHKAYDLLLKSQNFNQLLGATSSIGVGYSNLGDYKKANSYFFEALVLSRMSKSRNQEAQMLSNISIAYEKMGDYKMGYLYADTCISIYQSYISEEREKIRNELESRIELERKTKDIELLQQENQIKALKISKQKQIQWGIGLLAAMSILLVMILWRNNRLRKKTNELLLKEKEFEHAQRIQLELEYQKVQKENILAQFDTLKGQINPHFLFNSLNSLNTMLGNESVQAKNFIQQFTSLFRNTLELKDRHLVPLSEELRLCSAFLYLQQIRFGDKLKVEQDATLWEEKAWLPPFSMQMLIENAIKHNEVSEENPLHIRIERTGDDLLISNPVRLRKEKQYSTGIGLKNIVSRYEMLSDRRPKFFQENGIYRASLPLIREEANDE